MTIPIENKLNVGIPNYVQDNIIDEKDYLTPAWSNWFQQTITYLQNNFSQEGLVPPSLTTQQITDITANDNLRKDASGAFAPRYRGALYYDKDTGQLKVNIAGTIKVVTVT